MTQPLAFDESGVQFAWDSTSIGLAETCLRKYQLNMLLGWQPDKKSVHLIFGGLYATALEHYHQHVAAGMPVDEATVEVVHEALIATTEYEIKEDEWINGLELQAKGYDRFVGEHRFVEFNHNAKTRENLIRTIVWYLDQFGEEDSCQTVTLSTGEVAVEHSFRFEVDDGIMLAGHLDRLVEYTGHIYVQDQKTTGTTITQRFFEQFNPNTQMSLYSFAGQAIFDLPVKGVMIDAAQIAVGFTRFERGFTFRDEPQLDEWYDNAMYHIETARKATIEQHFPMNTSSCGNYGGCEFRGICGRSPAVRDQFLKGDFTQGERWDPLKAR